VAERFLFDTDVLVDYLRGFPEAVQCVEERVRALATSALVVAELYAGVRDGDEREALDALVLAFDVLPVDADVAEAGGLIRRDFGPRHGTGLVDAMIAATAQRDDATLVTLSAKHFPMLRSVLVPYRKSRR